MSDSSNYLNDHKQKFKYKFLKFYNIMFNIITIVFVVFILEEHVNAIKFFSNKISVTMASLVVSPYYGKTIYKIINANQKDTFSKTCIYDKDNINNGAYILFINKKTYEDKFYSISPLDRCKLASSLQKIFFNKDSQYKEAKDILIDLDLSPIPGCGKTEGLPDYYNSCQKKLDNVLISLAKEHKNIFLIDPTIFQNSKNECILLWKRKLEQFNIKFESPMLENSFGMTTYYPLNSLGGSLFGKKLKGSINIDYKDFTFCKSQKNSVYNKDYPLFIGASYGSQDRFLTPIGQIPGVFIHTFGYLTIKKDSTNSIHYSERFINIALDILFSTLTYFVFSRLWKYFFIRESPLLRITLFMIIFLTSLMFVFLASFLSMMIYQYLNIIPNFVLLSMVIFLDTMNKSVIEVVDENNIKNQSENKSEDQSRTCGITYKLCDMHKSIYEAIYKIIYSKIPIKIKNKTMRISNNQEIKCNVRVIEHTIVFIIKAFIIILGILALFRID